MKKLFSLLLLCGALCTLASCEKDNDNPEPETNRFVFSGKNYSNFTVSVTKDELNKGNYDIHILPAEDNTMERTTLNLRSAVSSPTPRNILLWTSIIKET